jgi:Ca-activated chloride channel family protein
MNPFANQPGILLLALFPLLLALAILSRISAKRQADRWGGSASLRSLSELPAREWDFLKGACLWVALGLAFLAFARPQWGEVVENVQKVGLDVVVLLDTSRSMDVTDIAPSRLERAKLEIRSFLTAAESDRIGLVAMAGVPISLSPLTEDTGAVSLLLDIADADLIPAQGTDLGKGIAEALRLLPQPHDRDQVILLFSDGEDQGTSALTAARTAARLGVKVFCVGVGTKAGGPVTGPNGKPMTDPATGSVAFSSLDESMLQQVAAISDGRYWKLEGAGSVVPQIMEELGHLKRKEYASQSRAQREDQFAWFLGPSVVLLILSLLIPSRRRAAFQAPRHRTKSGKGVAAGLPILLLIASSTAVRAGAQSVSDLGEQARIAFNSSNFEQSLGLYKKALQETTSPKTKILLHYDVGTCLLALKRYSEARDELILALAGEDPLVRSRAAYNLAHAFQADGDRDRALSTLRMLLTEEPDNRDGAALYEWILRQTPPEQPPPKNPPPPPPQTKPPDVLEQLPMPPPKELQDQVRPPEPSSPGMKPW